MNQNIEICFILVFGYLILGCNHSVKNPDKGSIMFINENNNPIQATIVSTIELIDSCMTKEYNDTTP